jgi:II/X family phage/plasmid replication protein
MTSLLMTSTVSEKSGFKEKDLSNGRPRITGIHITENLFVGSYRDSRGQIHSYVPMFFRHMSGYVHQGAAGYVYPDGFTVEWNSKKTRGKGSSRIYHSMYDKANNIKQKIAELKRKRVEDESHAYYIQDRLWYLEKLSDWCDDVGLARNEIKMKSKELFDRELTFIESWSYDVMCNVIRPHQFYKKMQVEETRMQDVSDFLISKGIPPKQANQAQFIHRAWVNGDDLKRIDYSPATMYRYRKMLLAVGVDIFVPCDISRIPLRVEKVTVKPAVVPGWYQLPVVPKTNVLKLVA